MATKDEVEKFLEEMKVKANVFDIAFRPRDKNTQALAELDINALERVEIIKGLTHKNYYRGPTPDTHGINMPDYYEFGVDVKGVEVYVKLGLGKENKRVDCMSFHKAEHRIDYPLR